MRINEISQDGSCTTVEKDALGLLLEIERRFRVEERKDLRSARGRSHQNLLRIFDEAQAESRGNPGMGVSQ